MAHPHEHIRAHEQKLAEHYVRRGGYKAGGRISDEKQDRKLVAEGVHKHERHDHPGEALTPLRGGGEVKGHASRPRADKMARGGNVKSRGPSKINIVIATGGGEPERQMAFRQGAQVGQRLSAAMPRPPVPPPGTAPPMPPRPPMGMPLGGAPSMMGSPPPGAIPPGGGAMPPRPGMMYRGGRLPATGAGGGQGRLEKAGIKGPDGMVKVRAHERRKAGGRVCE